MTASTVSSIPFSDPEFVPRDDVSEAERLVALGGFGQTLYQEDQTSLAEDLAGLGLYVNTDDQ